MTGITHAFAGLASGMALVSYYEAAPDVTALMLTASLSGSLFPDIDLATSKLGSKVKPVSTLIHYVFGHRTLFHSPLLLFALYGTAMHWVPAYQMYWLAFSIGMASHLLLDMFNIKGIPLFYPMKKRFHLAKIKTGGSIDAFLSIVFAICALTPLGRLVF